MLKATSPEMEAFRSRRQEQNVDAARRPQAIESCSRPHLYSCGGLSLCIALTQFSRDSSSTYNIELGEMALVSGGRLSVKGICKD